MGVFDDGGVVGADRVHEGRMRGQIGLSDVQIEHLVSLLNGLFGEGNELADGGETHGLDALADLHDGTFYVETLVTLMIF